MGRKPEIHITEAELEILQIVWEHQEATVKLVHEQLSVKRDAGYTTTLKQMQVMYEKGLLHRDDSQRQHVYRAAVKQSQVQKRFMDKIMSTFFKGSATQLVMQALDQYKTTEEELKEIEALIAQVKKNKK